MPFKKSTFRDSRFKLMIPVSCGTIDFSSTGDKFTIPFPFTPYLRYVKAEQVVEMNSTVDVVVTLKNKAGTSITTLTIPKATTPGTITSSADLLATAEFSDDYILVNVSTAATAAGTAKVTLFVTEKP